MRALLVPIKGFSQAKHRLAPVLASAERHDLAQKLAARVLRAARGMATFVCCDDDEVAGFARDERAEVLWTPGRGLSQAVTESVAMMASRGVGLAVVAHGDLPFVDDLSSFGDFETVTIAPDRRLDGTNVAAVPTSSGFRFSYGKGSFERHRAQATALGLGPSIVTDWRLAIDVDYPADLELLHSRPGPHLLADSPLGEL